MRIKLFKTVFTATTTAASLFGAKYYVSNNSQAYAEENLKQSNDKEKILNLSKQKISLDDMYEIWSKVQHSKHIGHIIWGSIPQNDEAKVLWDAIEKQIAQNNKSFKQYPSDFIHALLSSHVYGILKVGTKVEFLEQDKQQYNQYLEPWQVTKVYDMPEYGRYYAASYTNSEMNQLVLAHRGTTAVKEDLLSEDSPIKTDLKAILGRNIVAQQVAAYVVTKEVSQYAKLHGYNLSITGHSLGAWLAELSLYFSEYDFDQPAKAVTFDSPGSIVIDEFKPNMINPNTKRNIENLDITTYLSAPNFVNTCNKHIGKGYRLYPNIKKPDIIEKGLSWTDWALNKIGLKVQDLDLEPIWSIFGHSLTPFLATFDPETGKPYNYNEVDDWPVLKYTPKHTVGRNIITQWLHTADTDPNDPIELNAKHILKQIIKDTTLGSIIDLLSDAQTGRIDQNQYLTCWKYLQQEGASQGYPINIDLTPMDEFIIKYQGHHKILSINLQKDAFVPDREIDHYLLQLQSLSPEKIKSLYSEIVAQQLIDLRSQYLIIQDRTKKVITIAPGNDLTIEQLKDWMVRLTSIDSNITQQLKQAIQAIDYFDTESAFNRVFSNTNQKLKEFIKEFDNYDWTKNSQRLDLSLFTSVKTILSAPHFLQEMHTQVVNGQLSNHDLTNYLYCVYNVAWLYEYNLHDGTKARELLKLGKDLAEDYVKNIGQLKFDLDSLEAEELLTELSTIKHLPEVYTGMIYCLGRSYFYQGDRTEAVKYFELSKYLGEKLGLFEGYLSLRSGLGIIESDNIELLLKNGECESAKVKLLNNISLYKQLKVSNKEYKDSYNPNDNKFKPIIPVLDIYNRVECSERIIKYYMKLTLITSDINSRSEYVKAIIDECAGNAHVTGLLEELKKDMPNKKVSSVYNTLGDMLIKFYCYGKNEEFKELKSSLHSSLQSKEIDDLKFIQEVFQIAKSKCKHNDFTLADSYDGLMRVCKLQMITGSVSTKQKQDLSEKIKTYQDERDNINADLKRTIEYEDVNKLAPCMIKLSLSDLFSNGSDSKLNDNKFDIPDSSIKFSGEDSYSTNE